MSQIESALNTIDTAAARAIYDYDQWPATTIDQRMMLRLLRWLLKRYKYVLMRGARY